MACWLWLGLLEQLCEQPPKPWCTELQSTARLFGAAVLILASSIPPSTTPCELWRDVCVLHQRSIFQPRRYQTCWASSPRSHTVSSTLCHGVLTPAPLSAYLSIESKCTAPQIKIPICTHRTTTHQFIWQQQHMCGTLGRSPMECRVSGNPIRLHTFISDTGTHLLRITLPRRAWVQLSRLYTGVRSFRSCLYKCGTGLPAACECGVERTNCRPCCPLMSNPSTSSWTARPDSSGRWDNRMAAQHLPQKYGLAVVMKSWLNRRTSVLGSGSQSTRSPSISCQVNGLLGQGEINAG